MGHVTKCAWGAVAPKPDACLGIDVQEYATAQTMMQDPCLKLGYAHTLGLDTIGDSGFDSYYTINTTGEIKCYKYYATKITGETK